MKEPLISAAFFLPSQLQQSIQESMLDWDNYLRVGKVKDAHGLRGELYLLLFAGQADWLDRLESVILAGDDRENPSTEVRTLTLKKVRPHKKGLVANVSELQSRTQAEGFKGWLFYIPKSFLVSEPGEEIYLHEILQFVAFDSDSQMLGTVVDFSSNGAQDLLVLENAKGRFEVPFIPEFVQDVDFENKRLVLSIPEGLVDL